MRATRFVSGFVVAIAIAFTAGSVAALAQSEAPRDAKPAKASTFATLNGVTAVPMEQADLRTVKGLHIHFTTGSANEGHPLVEPATGWHFVNHTENNLGNGQAKPIAGPGYSGLCGAALLSPSLTIPGQSTSTGIGGGC